MMYKLQDTQERKATNWRAKNSTQKTPIENKMLVNLSPPQLPHPQRGMQGNKSSKHKRLSALAKGNLLNLSYKLIGLIGLNIHLIIMG